MLRDLLYDWLGLNRWLFLAIRSDGSSALDASMRTVSVLADYRYVPIYLVLGMTIAWGLHRAGRDAAAVRHGVWRLALGYGIGVVWVGALKVALDFPRPFLELVTGGVAPLGNVGAIYSLPSGHAAFAALIAATFWTLTQWRGRVALLLFAFAAGLSRVWLGAHFPADVVAGWLCGAAAAWLAQHLLAVVHRNRPAGLALLAALAVFGLDQVSKTVAVLAFDLRESIALGSYLNLGYWRNTGAAFSFLAEAGGWQQPLFMLIAAVASYWLRQLILASRSAPLEKFGYAFILGAALGNLFDRVFRGAVVDWIDVHWASWHWPAFNLADTGITLGVALLIFSTVRTRPAAEDALAERELERKA